MIIITWSKQWIAVLVHDSPRLWQLVRLGREKQQTPGYSSSLAGMQKIMIMKNLPEKNRHFQLLCFSLRPNLHFNDYDHCLNGGDDFQEIIYVQHFGSPRDPDYHEYD